MGVMSGKQRSDPLLLLEDGWRASACLTSHLLLGCRAGPVQEVYSFRQVTQYPAFTPETMAAITAALKTWAVWQVSTLFQAPFVILTAHAGAALGGNALHYSLQGMARLAASTCCFYICRLAHQVCVHTSTARAVHFYGGSCKLLLLLISVSGMGAEEAEPGAASQVCSCARVPHG